MNKIVMNKSNDFSYDSRMIKARAILFDVNGRIIICNMNGSISLPGGTAFLDEETPLDTVNRELFEELGVEGLELDELVEIEYYHDNFPIYMREGFDRRLNVVYYYICKHPVDLVINSHLTDYEKENDMKIGFLSLDEIYNLINKSNSNKWKQFTDLEMMTILNIVKKNGLLNSKERR